MKWTERFPDPGPAPVLGPEPSMRDAEAWMSWGKTRSVFNQWLYKKRKHRVAVALEALIARAEARPETEDVDPIEVIVGQLAIAYLDGELSNNDTGVLGMFGL